MKLSTLILLLTLNLSCIAQTKKPKVVTPKANTSDSTNIRIMNAANNTILILRSKKLIAKY